jgi:hypothetical protein
VRRDQKFRQAAWTYASYGLVYWLGGLALVAGGLGPRGGTGGGLAWFVAGALFVVVVPWLLARERGWFVRWVLSRRDLARVLTVLVAYRALEIVRIARQPRLDVVSVLGFDVPMHLGAWAFALVTVVTAVMLARAAWSRD